MDALGTPHYYTASSQDVANRFVASALLYGSPTMVPIPDLQRTSFLLMVGANPFVSHGSVLTAPKVKEQLHGDRRARRPRRRRRPAPHRDRAKHFEHVAGAPGHRRLAAALAALRARRGGPRRRGRARAPDRRLGALARDGRAASRPRQTAARTRRRAADSCARSRATWRRPTAPRSTGARAPASGRFGTLVAFLLDLLGAATGNLDRPGGAVFGLPRDRARRGRRAGRARHLRQGALAGRRLPRRARRAARRR